MMRLLISQGLIPRSSAANKLSEAEANTPQLAAGKFITKNETLNTVLMERRLYCRENQISCMVVADGEQLNFLNTGDLYLILRNALNNAIESVVQLADPQRRIIDVRVYAHNNLLMIQIENEFWGSLRFADGLPQPTKSDRDYRGIGLKTIRQIAEQYGGGFP